MDVKDIKIGDFMIPLRDTTFLGDINMICGKKYKVLHYSTVSEYGTIFIISETESENSYIHQFDTNFHTTSNFIFFSVAEERNAKLKNIFSV